MDFTIDIVKMISNFPASINLSLSLLILAIILWLKIKKAIIEEKKSENDIQIAQIESLMQEIKLLSDELDKTRKQLSDLHLQNLELMEQLREANKRISELELALDLVSSQVGGI